MPILDTDIDLADMAQPIVRLVQQSGRIRDQDQLAQWLGGSPQALIPHSVALAGWGDFSSGQVRFCCIGQSGHRMADDEAERLLRAAHAHWLAGGMQAQVLPGSVFLRGAGQENGSMHTVVHGLRDLRVSCDSVYAFLMPADASIQQARQAARLLLPIIDLAFRQAIALDDDGPCSTFGDEVASGLDAARDELQITGQPLSEREEEVMRWVRLGKTNSEIAIILHLSTFTVKNHMRRIYRKLNALNRAQAVSRAGARTWS